MKNIFLRSLAFIDTERINILVKLFCFFFLLKWSNKVTMQGGMSICVFLAVSLVSIRVFYSLLLFGPKSSKGDVGNSQFLTCKSRNCQMLAR